MKYENFVLFIFRYIESVKFKNSTNFLILRRIFYKQRNLIIDFETSFRPKIFEKSTHSCNSTWQRKKKGKRERENRTEIAVT